MVSSIFTLPILLERPESERNKDTITHISKPRLYWKENSRKYKKTYVYQHRPTCRYRPWWCCARTALQRIRWFCRSCRRLKLRINMIIDKPSVWARCWLHWSACDSCAVQPSQLEMVRKDPKLGCAFHPTHFCTDCCRGGYDGPSWCPWFTCPSSGPTLIGVSSTLPERVSYFLIVLPVRAAGDNAG